MDIKPNLSFYLKNSQEEQCFGAWVRTNFDYDNPDKYQCCALTAITIAKKK